MNKIKLAIAYIITQIKYAYYAAVFALSVITSEFPYGRRINRRVEITTPDLRDRNSTAYSPSPFGNGTTIDKELTVGAIGQDGYVAPSTPNYSCDGLFSFFDGGVVDRLSGSDGDKPTGTTRPPVEDTQSRKVTASGIQLDCAWHELESRDRQAIILNAMWQRQAESEYHELFSVDDVIEMCDRPDTMTWDTTFEDLLALMGKSRISIFEFFDNHGKVFYGFYWGVR